MADLTLAQALNRALDEGLRASRHVMLMGEDVGATGGVFRVTDGLPAKYGPERVVDSPLAESGIAGVGLGLAIAGMRPVLEMQFMGFSYPAFDQVDQPHRADPEPFAPPIHRALGDPRSLRRRHRRSRAPLRVDQVIYAHTPGLKVVVPSRPRRRRPACWPPRSTIPTRSSSWNRFVSTAR